MSNLVPLNAPLVWREYKLAPTGEPDAYLFDDGEVYIGVAKEDDNRWGACIAIGDLEGSAFGIDYRAALETCLAGISCLAATHEFILKKAFP